MKDKNLSSQDSCESLTPCGVPIIVPHALSRSCGDVLEKEEACWSSLKEGQTLLKAHGVQGAESQRCCELTGVTASYKIHRGVGRQPAPEVVLQAMGFGLGCANLNPTRLGQARAREQT